MSTVGNYFECSVSYAQIPYQIGWVNVPVVVTLFNQIKSLSCSLDPRQPVATYGEPTALQQVRCWLQPSEVERDMSMFTELLGCMMLFNALGLPEQKVAGISEQIVQAVARLAVSWPPYYYAGWGVDVTITEVIVLSDNHAARAGEESCAICLEEFAVDDHHHHQYFHHPQYFQHQQYHHRLACITRLPCLHTFHRKCIGNWLERKRTCPLCRARVIICLGAVEAKARLEAAVCFCGHCSRRAYLWPREWLPPVQEEAI